MGQSSQLTEATNLLAFSQPLAIFPIFLEIANNGIQRFYFWIQLQHKRDDVKENQQKYACIGLGKRIYGILQLYMFDRL